MRIRDFMIHDDYDIFPYFQNEQNMKLLAVRTNTRRSKGKGKPEFGVLGTCTSRPGIW